ncbi:helix-turn-helix transcriptional regulator, partial [Cytobacillus oceanisediminis]|nr:helix-turn-helix transcriptional regulator [Cytobacillus oceanisediminis]
MAIREALMALLEQGPASAYQLKRRFERTTSSIWPLNMGQVSTTTLQRLHRDGLIEQVDGSE